MSAGSGSIGNQFGRTFRIPILDIRHGRRLASVYLKGDLEAAWRAASALHEELREAGISILGFSCWTSDDGSTIECSGILDVTEAKAPLDEAAERLRASGIFQEVEVWTGPVDWFAALRGLVPEAGEARAVIMGERALRGLFLGARESLGEGAGAAFVYYAGVFTGRAMGEWLSRAAGEGANALELASRIWEARGYAPRIEVLAGQGEYRIEAWRLVECESLSGRRRGKTSHFFRGMVAGLLSAAEGGEWEVEEVECINDGSDKCAFEARRKR